MIRSFANKETEEVFHGIHTHEVQITLPHQLLKTAEERLDLLNGVDSYDSLCKIPSISPDVKGGKQGEHSIPIQDNWRLFFYWDKDGPSDVEIKKL